MHYQWNTDIQIDFNVETQIVFLVLMTQTEKLISIPTALVKVCGKLGDA